MRGGPPCLGASLPRCFWLRPKAAISLLFSSIAALLPVISGCHAPRAAPDESRYRRGVVFVLPGIEGRSAWNREIALGLDEGGVTSAIEIYDWTTGLPGNFVGNLTDIERNRRQARILAQRIVDYRRRNPGAPVHLIGHSGGGGIAVLALEALPPGRRIDMALLLAPALSPGHNLADALRRTRFGVCNFYSHRDVTLLKVGTSLFGPIDRAHGAAAGAVGFETPEELSAADRELYEKRLRQVPWSSRLERYGADGSHVGWTSRQFAREYLAPLVTENEAARPLPAERRR